MALGYLDDSKLYAIASAIRAKTGDSATMTVDDMPDEIGSISTGAQVEPLSVTENGTYSAPTGYAYSPVTVDVAGSGGGDFDAVVKRTITSASGSIGVIGQYAFALCDQLASLSFPNAINISSYAFYSCRAISSVEFPNVLSIGGNAFYSCVDMTTASFPKCTSIGYATFSSCSKLSDIYMPLMKSAGSYAFASCSALESASFSMLKSIPEGMYQYCRGLKSVHFGSASQVGRNAFFTCNSLESVDMPNVQTVSNSAFARCYALTTLSFPKASVIYSWAFASASALVSFYLLGSSVPALSNSNAFIVTPIANGGGSIFVKSSMYSRFTSATNWSYFASRMVSV